MADTKRTAFRVRIAGWTLVLLGGSGVLLSGGYSHENPYPFAGGVFAMIAGMILTSTAVLMGILAQRRRLAELAGEKGREARGGK
jgi:Kef-type K+ transport system membrane component KefB